MPSPARSPAARRGSVSSRKIRSKASAEADWIEQRFSKMEERDGGGGDSEGNDDAGLPPISTADENLLTCLRNISAVVESGVRKLYGHSIVDMKTVFASFDEDGDGTIDRMELDAGLTRLGLPSTPLLIESVFQALSNNGTDIKYSRFVSMIEWSLSNTGRTRRSVYRGVSAAPIASGRLWQAHLRIPASLVFLSKPKPAEFLFYTDDEVEAATRVDSALMERVGVVDAAQFLNFRDLSSLTNASAQAAERELARREHMTKAGRTSVLRMLGQMIQSKRSLYGAKLADLHASFKAMDTDNSGTIERAELDKALDRLGLGLTHKQKLDVADLLCCGDASGSITLGSYTKVMNEAKRAYAEELKAHRTLSAMGLLKPQVRRLQAPRSPQEAEQQWDAHFAAPCSKEQCLWDTGGDLRLDALNGAVKKDDEACQAEASLASSSVTSSTARRREWERITDHVETPVTTRPGEPVRGCQGADPRAAAADE